MTNTSLFTIDPSTLRDLDTPVSATLQQSLNENNIKLQLHVYDSYPEDHNKPVLVLLHGNSASMRAFSEQMSYFHNEYRVIAIDLLGHGKSSKPGLMSNIAPEIRDDICAAFYHPLAMMAEVTQCLESRHIKQATLFGWSLGGHIAYGIAAANPELVHSVISLGSPPVMFSRQGFLAGFHDWFPESIIPLWINSPQQHDKESSKSKANDVGFFSADDIEMFAEDAAVTDAMMRKYLFIDLKKFDDQCYQQSPLNGERFVQHTDIPLYIAVGDDDFAMTPESFTRMTGKFSHPRSQVDVIPNGSHAVFKTHADSFNPKIAAWLKTIR